MGRRGKKKFEGLSLEPMQAIGEALQRTYQGVAEEAIPDKLLQLVERLQEQTDGGQQVDVVTEIAAIEANAIPSDRRH